MAGDWIKMRVNLRKHPKVIAMSRQLGAEREFMDWWSDPQRTTCNNHVTEVVTFENVTRVTVCGLLEVWGSINAALGSDDVIEYMTIMDIDDIAGIPGFGEAMQSVGWASEIDDGEINGVQFNNFREFNTPDSERKKAKSNAERQKEYRERQKQKQEENDRNESNESLRREEKRREEVINPPVVPPRGERRGTALSDDWTLPKAWGEWAVQETGMNAEQVRDIANRFRDYWIAVPGAKGRKKDWAATWRNWIRRDNERGQSNAGNRQSGRASVAAAIDDIADTSWADGLQ